MLVSCHDWTVANNSELSLVDTNQNTNAFNTPTKKGLWTDLVSIIPEQELLAWYLEMMAVNLDMQILMERVKMPGIYIANYILC